MDTKISENHIYNLFRYQILPLSNVFQLSIDSNITSIDELKQNKNRLFLEALNEIPSYFYTRGELAHKTIFSYDNVFGFRLGHKKLISITDKNFQETRIEDWPNVPILINNDPAIQIAAIKGDRKVFFSPETTSKILEENLSRYLKRYHLGVYFEPIFEERKFWEIVESYPKSIVQVNFELISPNLSNISKTLKIDLGKLNTDTNTHKTNIELNSAKDASLSIDRNNSLINSLVEYSSAGGGIPTVRVRGLRRKIKASHSVKEISIDEIEISNKEPNEIVRIVKGLLE